MTSDRETLFRGAIVECYLAQQEARMLRERPAETADGLLDAALEAGDVYDFLFGDFSFSDLGLGNLDIVRDRGIPTDYGMPLCFPYFDYREMASALVRRQERDSSFRAGAEASRAVFDAIDPGYVRERHSLEGEAEVIARTLANISCSACLVFFAASEQDVAGGAGLALSSRALAALFQSAWLNEDLLRLVGCWRYMLHFTYMYPGADKYMWTESSHVPDGYRDHAAEETVKDLYYSAMRRTGAR